MIRYAAISDKAQTQASSKEKVIVQDLCQWSRIPRVAGDEHAHSLVIASTTSSQ